MKNKKILFANSKNGGGITKLNSNAFTLIELLAIIVILAIIAVITVPIILNIIENSKKGAAQNSAYGFKDAVNKWYVDKLSSDPDFRLKSQYTVQDGRIYDPTDEEDEGILIPVSGEKPSSGVLNYSNNKFTTGNLVIGDYKVTFNENGTVTTTKNTSSSSSGSGNEQVAGSWVKWYGPSSSTGTTSFNSSWNYYIRENSDGDKEVCGVVNGDPICLEPNKWDCGTVNYDEETYKNSCSSSDGYIVTKLTELSGLGFDCGIEYDGSLNCNNGDVFFVYFESGPCLDTNGGDACWNQEYDFCQILNDGTVTCN